MRKDELRLARAYALDIDLGQKLGVEQRAVLRRARIVDRITDAEIVEPVGAARMLTARNQKGVDYRSRFTAARRARSNSALRKPRSNMALSATSWASPRKTIQLFDLVDEQRLVIEELAGQAVNLEGLFRHVAFGIEVTVKGPAGGEAVDELNAADFN